MKCAAGVKARGLTPRCTQDPRIQSQTARRKSTPLRHAEMYIVGGHNEATVHRYRRNKMHVGRNAECEGANGFVSDSRHVHEQLRMLPACWAMDKRGLDARSGPLEGATLEQ